MAADLMGQFRTYLVGQGLVRHYTDAGSAPPLYVEPPNGTPSPADLGIPLVLGAIRYTGPVSGPYESFLRRDIIEIWIRVSARKAPSAVIAAWALESKLREEGARTSMGSIRI
jgi:hypothetical protein